LELEPVFLGEKKRVFQATVHRPISHANATRSTRGDQFLIFVVGCSRQFDLENKWGILFNTIHAAWRRWDWLLTLQGFFPLLRAGGNLILKTSRGFSSAQFIPLEDAEGFLQLLCTSIFLGKWSAGLVAEKIIAENLICYDYSSTFSFSVRIAQTCLMSTTNIQTHTHKQKLDYKTINHQTAKTRNKKLFFFLKKKKEKRKKERVKEDRGKQSNEILKTNNIRNPNALFGWSETARARNKKLRKTLSNRLIFPPFPSNQTERKNQKPKRKQEIEKWKEQEYLKRSLRRNRLR